jgi:hypothetical protein
MDRTMSAMRPDRRRERRVLLPDAGERIRIRLGAGGHAWLVDLSAHGAGIETTRTLRPGTTISFCRSSAPRGSTLEATVVTCRVTSLGSGGVRFRCGVRFAVPSDLLRELASQHGYQLPIRPTH